MPGAGRRLQGGRGVGAGDVNPPGGAGSSPEEAFERVDDPPGRVAGPVRVLLARPALPGARLHLGQMASKPMTLAQPAPTASGR